MPQPGPRKQDDSLFSLELVVEKVYIPHTPCKFPAVAFRLLDYPTIVIKHVEDDLTKALRRKISFDPYFQLPDQFTELKDRHGNFMVNKGKSCLFRIPQDILKQHLANTPLYVMIIDLFPEVPKLIGNSSVPLNTLMDFISRDIAKLGPTVPSIHGDKGLFKLYNLMGLEIGYFVLGFRLLCLGPSLIPHLPESVLLQRSSKIKKTKENRIVDEMIQKRENQTEDIDDSYESEIQLRNSACMTDAVKHDALIQTVDMQDKAIHAALSGVSSQTETRTLYDKESCSISTQTEGRKSLKEAQNVQKKWVEFIGDGTVDHDDIIINNIDCPPPLFYNSNALPILKIHRQNLCQVHDEILVDELSDVNSYDGQGLEKDQQPGGKDIQQEHSSLDTAVCFKPERVYKPPVLPIRQARIGETVQGLQIAPNPDTVFPLLTALIQELSLIQNPQLLLNVSNKIQSASLKLMKPDQSPKSEVKFDHRQKSDKLSPTVLSTVASALIKKAENPKENKNITIAERPSRPENYHPSSMNRITHERNQQSLKQNPSHPQKKIKLVYGITNTQRLRLQKANPQWLKAVEKEVADMKKNKQPAMKQTDVDDMNVAQFSDTLTEVRRLAEKELNNTACEDTLNGVTNEAEPFPAKHKNANRISVMKEQSSENDRRKLKQDANVVRSSNYKSLQNTPSPKHRLRLQTSTKSKKVTNSLQQSDEFIRKPVPHVRHLIGSASPSHVDQEINAKGIEDQLSPDLSSRSRSIEVCLPSHDLAVSDDDIPLPDDSSKDKRKSHSINFQKYLSKDVSLPESISGTANTSHNVSAVLDDNSPLESTRYSKNLNSDKDSKHYQSTDYDTRQFQSTDEQELQDLLSEDENPSTNQMSGRNSVASLRASQKFPVINPQLSENSPVPSIRRSSQKLDPTTLSYVPSFSQRYDPCDSSTSGTVKSNITAEKDFKLERLSPKEYDSQEPDLKRNGFATSKNGNLSKSPSSPRHITPRHQKPLLGSLHTDSLSSYMPSDPDNIIISSSISGIYSDDFQLHDIEENEETSLSLEKLPKFIPSSKLGYTIN